jgi:hypothetical protein
MYRHSPLAELTSQHFGQCCRGMFGHAVRSDAGKYVEAYKPEEGDGISYTQNINSLVLNLKCH